MASSSKRKTTMAKLNRERGLVERRMAKAARKAARKEAAALEAQGLTEPTIDDDAAEASEDTSEA